MRLSSSVKNSRCSRGRGDALLHVAVEFGAHRIGGVAGMDEPGKRDQPAKQVLDRLVALHRLGERRPAIGAAASSASLPL